MICDVLNTFCDNVALNTGAAGNYLIGDVIPLGVARNVGADSELYLVITVDTLATSGGAATLAIDLITDDNAAMSSPAVIATVVPVTALAALTQGAILCRLNLPSSDLYEAFIGLRQTTGVAAFTAGKINAFLTQTAPARRSYPDGI